MHRTAATLLAALSAGVAAQPIQIDERFDDWSTIAPIASDPAGDSTTGRFDVTTLWAASAGSTLYLSFDDAAAAAGSPVNLQSGLSADGTPRLRITNPSTGRSITISHRERRAWLDGDRATVIDWFTLGYRLLPTVASARYELAIDLAPIGVGIGDTVTIDLDVPDPAAEGFAGPAPDALAAPASFTLAAPAVELARRSADRAPGTTLRVAAFNTLFGGLTIRPEPVGRLIQAADADIYLLAEESGTLEYIEGQFNQLMPLPEGRTWHASSRVLRISGDDIASNGDEYIVANVPITPIANSVPDRFRFIEDTAIALVGNSPADSVLVMSVHWRCCGNVGSGSDTSRIFEATEISQFIAGFRAGTAEPSLAAYKDVPIILGGDWNLVGSNDPRTILTTDPAGPQLEHLVLPGLIGGDAITWRNTSGLSFSPGLLDLIAYSPGSITPTGGFVLDSADLNQIELNALGLQPTDSLDASDHLLLVADFAQDLPCSPADLAQPTGQLNVDDVLAFLAGFTTCSPAADLAQPAGTCDIDDVLAFLTTFAGGCP